MSLLVSGRRQKARDPLFQSNLVLSWKEGQIDREANVQKSSHPPLPDGAFPSAKPMNSVLIHLAAAFLRCLIPTNNFQPHKFFFVLTKKLVS